MGRSLWGQTPRQSILAACKRSSRAEVLGACLDLLAGKEVDPAMVRALGGPRADRALIGAGQSYWLRVWAVRGLLWNWHEVATSALCEALRDESWRVREMAATVVSRHQVADALSLVAELQADRVLRVRVAANRALIALTNASS